MHVIQKKLLERLEVKKLSTEKVINCVLYGKAAKIINSWIDKKDIVK